MRARLSSSSSGIGVSCQHDAGIDQQLLHEGVAFGAVVCPLGGDRDLAVGLTGHLGPGGVGDVYHLCKSAQPALALPLAMEPKTKGSAT